MSNEIEIEGLEEALILLDSHRDQVREQARQAVRVTVEETVADTQQNLRNQGAVKTGRLLHSYHGEEEEDRTSVSGTSSTDVEYAPFLEHGTRRARARPHALPAFEKNKGNFVKRCEL